MKLPIEGESMEALAALADNPPQSPHGQPRRNALVLYIARVPGSRDVILTPHKPQRDIITQHDVQSALYLLHYDRHEDFQRQSRRVLEGKHSLVEYGQEAKTAFTIKRKALMGGKQEHEIMRVVATGQTTMTLIRRNAVDGSQCDVAKILDLGVREPSYSTLSRPPKDISPAQTRFAKASVLIQLLHSGYWKFKHENHYDSPSAGLSFQRTLWRDKSPRRKMNGRIVETEYCMRNDMSDFYNSKGFPANTSRGVHVIPTFQKRLRRKGMRATTGYRFKSPWNGDCYFHSNMLGTSLKCRHTLPPLESTLEAQDVVVSELRFNITAKRTKTGTRTSTSVPSNPAKFRGESPPMYRTIRAQAQPSVTPEPIVKSLASFEPRVPASIQDVIGCVRMSAMESNGVTTFSADVMASHRLPPDSHMLADSSNSGPDVEISNRSSSAILLAEPPCAVDVALKRRALSSFAMTRSRLSTAWDGPLTNDASDVLMDPKVAGDDFFIKQAKPVTLTVMVPAFCMLDLIVAANLAVWLMPTDDVQEEIGK